jgi:hypothetical protein
MWGKYCRTGQVTWYLRIACWIPKTINSHTGYVILVAFPRQQWFYSRASMLRYTYIACLVLISQSNSLYRRYNCSFFRAVNISPAWCVLLPLWRPHISSCERLPCPSPPPNNLSPISIISNERQQFKTSRESLVPSYDWQLTNYIFVIVFNFDSTFCGCFDFRYIYAYLAW